MPVSFDDLIPEQKKGVSFDDLIPQDQPSTIYDVGASLASGIGRGTAGLVGLPGTIGDAINNGLSWATGLPQLPQSQFSGGSITDAANAISGDALAYDPQTTAGEYAGTVGEFLPGAAIGGGSISNLLRFGVLPGVASEAAGQATEGTATEPYARIAAALISPAVPALAARAISPYAGAVSAERQALVDALRAEGVNPTAGQVTGSRGLRFAESELGGAAARNLADDQARAFTEAAMSRAGQQGIATPQNMVAMNDRLEAGFNAISARNVVQGDRQLAQDMAGVLTEYNRVLPSAQREIVNNMSDDIVGVIRNNNGAIPGDVYQSTRSRLSRMSHNARNSDPEYAGALRGLRNALDGAMTRSVRPEDAAEWATLRSQWGNKKALERAAAGAGEAAAEGLISPAKLRQSVATGRQGQYVSGSGDLDELARAGQILSPLPDSGTASRLAVRGLMSTPAAAGAIAGGYTGDVLTGLAGAAAGAAVPAVAGRVLMSKLAQSYLTNQVAPQMSVIDPRMRAVIAALIANGGG